ncbi:MAG: hypothetical protein QXU32_10810 [Nitrososphaerales archaeon]
MVVKNKQLTKRAIYVYLPNVRMANEWKRLAEKSRVPISKFVVEHVENSLKQEDKKGYASRAELLKQLKQKDEEIAKLKQENRLLKMLTDNLDRDLKLYRAKPFLEEEFEGVRAYARELIQLLKKNKTVDSDHILHELGIKPKDAELVKAINKQLEYLQAYGLVEPTARGWRWIE